jgi:hypothetical protein
LNREGAKDAKGKQEENQSMDIEENARKIVDAAIKVHIDESP